MKKQSLAANYGDEIFCLESSPELEATLRDIILEHLHHELVQPVHALRLMLANDHPFPGISSSVGLRANSAIDMLVSMARYLAEAAQLAFKPPKLHRVRIDLGSLLPHLASTHKAGTEKSDITLKIIPSKLVISADRDIFGQTVLALLRIIYEMAEVKRIVLGARPHGIDQIAVIIASQDNGKIRQVFTEMSAHQSQYSEHKRHQLIVVVAMLAVLRLGAGLVIRSKPGQGSMLKLILPRSL